MKQTQTSRQRTPRLILAAIRVIGAMFACLGLRAVSTETGMVGTKMRFAPPDRDRFRWLQRMGIRTIIDVGAHTGEAALELHRILPDARLYSFEPLHDCYLDLCATMRDVPAFRAFNLALGRQREIVHIHRSEFSGSSSLLRMGDLHKKTFPFSSEGTIENAEVDTLDNVANDLDLDDPILLKVDVQGYEREVIMGAAKTLPRVRVILVETSFAELYVGQPLFSDIYDLLSGLGFRYSGSWGQCASPLDGMPLEEDSIFVRE